ncbi:LysR substrate-binding domain-containing protein [Nocardioides sp. LHG3406-4]|uniref:LysR substrate-binding domain-containing protein n=1 Tax=Nocardioides sp. LHG3406-4 TaxID=2804575 RepID=UPI003CF46202
MELRHLRYFVAVAEELHFGRAAARLHMAQPPLSQQVRALEAELGVALLHRTTRRVELTAAGSAYLQRARAVLGELDDAAHEAQQVAAGVVGRLVVGCVGSATYSLLPLLARGLTRELPGIEFSFRGEMLVPDQVLALQGNDIDIALLRPPVHDTLIQTSILRHDRLVVAVPDDHPLAARRRVRVAQLADVDLLVHAGRPHSVMHAEVVRLCRQAGFEPRFRAEVGETSTLITLVAGGLGAAVVPEPVTALPIQGVVYRPLVGGGRVALAVAHRRDREEAHLRRAVEAVRRLVDPS